MVCQRCRGLLVCETFDDLSIETDSRYTATRCINCGCIEDAVIHSNRFRRLESAGESRVEAGWSGRKRSWSVGMPLKSTHCSDERTLLQRCSFYNQP